MRSRSGRGTFAPGMARVRRSQYARIHGNGDHSGCFWAERAPVPKTQGLRAKCSAAGMSSPGSLLDRAFLREQRSGSLKNAAETHQRKRAEGAEVMPEGDRHRSLVNLVRAFPVVVRDLLKDAMGEEPPPPRFRRPQTGSEELSILTSQKLTADNVVVFENARRESILGVVFEIQLKPENERLFRMIRRASVR